ncbi:biliverdin-producing heme oxygenase [Pseudomonas massiliensis]|uniref:biliverdin-producing heme oxygenase n=1 Tax=Pseudomonas massiliensis TaxID=522492 RepID=UPI000B12017A|nr:biliverdin-producing heme oxygenase [Pseudomonas massiliensis]
MRDATRDLHAALDAASPLTTPGFDGEAYLAYARRVLGWMRPVERHLQAAGLPWPADLHMDARASKSGWLLEDLGVDASPPDCPYTPRPQDLAGAYGLAYVCEGATLGGAYLYKRLSPALAPMPLRWLRGYGAQTGPLWKTFLAHLATDVTTPEAIDTAAQAARAGFQTFERWMRDIH